MNITQGLVKHDPLNLLQEGEKRLTYKHYIKLLMCDVPTSDCYESNCVSCKNKDISEEINKVKSFFIDQDILEIRYWQWETTDRANLCEKIMEVNDFVEIFIEKLNILKTHSFIASSQTKFYSEKSKNVASNEAVIGGDFAENYGVSVQNEIQSFHFTK